MHVLLRMAGLVVATSMLAVSAGAQTVPPPPSATSWHWQNLLPHGNSLNAVTCPTESVCYAVGSMTAMVSHAPGQWSTRLDRAFGTLTAISCPGGDTCYALSNSSASVGAVLGTADGGATWTRLRPAGSSSLTYISCPTRLVCYVTGTYAGRVIMTRDGGHTWVDTPISFRPVALACPTRTVCYAPIDVSQIHSPPPSVAVSTDGGKIWALRPVGLRGQLWQIACVAENACYVIAFTGNDLGTPKLLRTANGGNSWRQEAFPEGTYFRGGSLACPTASTCYIAGDNGTPPGILLATNNAGKSWVRRAGPASRPTALACEDRLHCAAVGAGGAIDRTVNGWVTWTHETKNAARRLANPQEQYALNAVACTTVVVCYAAGDRSTVLRTSNAGRRWQNRSSGLTRGRGALDVSTLDCPTTTTCFAGGLAPHPPGSGAQVYSTRDSGKTWRANPGKGFAVVTCPSVTICYAGGEKGTFRVSRNAGRTWTAMKTPLSGTQYTIVTVSCPTTVRCYAGAIGPSEPPPHPSSNLGALVSTSDGGRTWTRAETDPYPAALACRTTTDCFALIAESYKTHNLVTHDGGRTWRRYDALAPGTWLSLTCPDANTCYAVGTSGNVAVTRDGGTTWVAETTPTFNSLFGVTCTARDTCFAVGTFGTILDRRNPGTTFG